jgi:hypothetical protein
MSSVHAVVVSVAVAIWIARNGFWAWTWNWRAMVLSEGIAELDWIVGSVAVSAGYFIADLIVMWRHKEIRDAVFLLHHFVIMPFFLAAIVMNYHGTVYHFFFLLEEISTPALNLRWMVRKRSQRAFKYASFVFALLFFVGRMLLGNYLYFSLVLYMLPEFLASPVAVDQVRMHLIGQTGMCTVSLLLNYYWSLEIISSLKRLNAPRKRE